MLERARVLVTGGAGFLGGHLVERLAGANDVVVLDRQPRAHADRLGTVMDRIAYVEGDLRRPDDVAKAVRRGDVVFHLGALISPVRSFQEPEAFTETNVQGTLTVLRAAKAAGARRVVFTSSCAVYGYGRPPLREDAPLDPRSPYAVTKAAGELWCRLYHELGTEAVALRLFNLYGPYQAADGPYAAVVPKFLDAILSGRKPTIYGDGEQTRDFVYVDDAVDALARAATADGVSGEVVNVGTGEPVSVNRLLSVVNDVLGTRVEAERREAHPGDIRASYADTEKAQGLLGFRPRVSLAQGLLAAAETLKRRR